MGPMGYGRGPMSLMGMVRGMGGGYGGYNPYARMMGGYGMSGMAPGGMSNAQMLQAAGDQTGGYAGAAQLQAQRAAMEQAQPQMSSNGPMGELNSSQGSTLQAAPEGAPGAVVPPQWAGAIGAGMGASTGGGAGSAMRPIGPEGMAGVAGSNMAALQQAYGTQGGYGIPRGMGYGGGWGGPMSLGALARMGMFRR